MKPPRSQSYRSGRPEHGMTLVELITVMAIILILFSLAATTYVQRQGNLQLSTGIVQLQGFFNGARQLALTHNKYVQMRFYKPAAGSPIGYDEVGIFLADSPFYSDYDVWTARGLFRAEGKPEPLPDSVVIPSGAASQLLGDLANDTAFTRTGNSTVGGRPCTFVAFYFRPNGATDFQTIKDVAYPVNTACVSLVPRTSYLGTAPALPTNFATFTFTAVNGQYSLARP